MPPVLLLILMILGFFALVFLAAHAGIAFFKVFLGVLLFPLKIAIGVLGFLVWLVFLPFKLLLLVAMGLLGLIMIPLVAGFLCVAALLWMSC
jgi:hypothetical protein